MSFADDMFAEYGTPQITEYFGDKLICTVMKRNGETVGESIDAVLGPIRTYEEIDRSGTVQKRQGRRIDILKDAVNGVDRPFLDARCLLSDGSMWDIESIESETGSMFRLIVVRSEDIEFRRKGFYDR